MAADKSRRQFVFPIERGSVADLADALAGPARRAHVLDSVGTNRPVSVPATFLVTAERFNPVSVLRPAIQPDGSPQEHTDTTPLPPLHASQAIRYRRYPRIGESLLVRTVPGESWRKLSRHGGHIRFTQRHSTFVDAAGDPIAELVWTDAHASATHVLPQPLPAGPEPAAPLLPTRSNMEASFDCSADFTTIAVPKLTLGHLVRYAGASGDYIPVHHDPDEARAHGFADVFANGMFTLGRIAAIIESAYGTGTIYFLSGQFRRPLFLGESLQVTLRRAERGSAELLHLNISACARDGSAILTGAAEVKLDTGPHNHRDPMERTPQC